ncbi:MAG: hydantoinase/oxoprolinase family protein [Gammaproteobacteria bacterium]
MLTGPIRIAVDIGGTFTDLQILEEHSGRHAAFKTPTTPQDPSEGLMLGIQGAAEHYGFALGQVTSLMHGTTIATNAVLENKLPRGALVTTAGFKDVLEIGRHVRRDIYASVAEPRRLLVERALRFEVSERLGANGQVREPLDEHGARQLARRIAASGVETVAVCLLHAYANPDHELQLARILEQALGNVHISLSHAISPELREYERMSTTVLNALLMPVVTRYLERLRWRMREHEFAPAVYLMQSNGGVTTPEAAAEQPARLLLSGPSGGALAAQTLGERLGEPNLLAVDMGGTSYDVSVVHRGRTRLVNQGEVDGCPVRLPMVEIRTIGAGGGSIARADDTGRLHVGPRSAGAMPGPVAYGKGGHEPTVTDANVALGRIDPAYFLGGSMALDDDGARRAIAGRVAGPLGLDETQAAHGIVQVAVAHMAAATRLSLFEKGLDPKDFALLSFGGAGGLHAAEVAAELGVRRVIYPRDAGTLSAWGMLFCDVVHDCARSRLVRADASALGTVRELARVLLKEGTERLARDGVAEANRRFTLRADLRYTGQAYEITVDVGRLDPGEATWAETVTRFHEQHRLAYAHANPDEAPELVTLRLEARGRQDQPRATPVASLPTPEPKAKRRAYAGGAWLDVPVYERDTLGAGAMIEGPALVQEAYASVYLPQDWRLQAAASGDLIAGLKALNDEPGEET